MPAASPTGQPEPALDWFGTEAGRVLLASEAEAARDLLGQGRGLPWLWLTPVRHEVEGGTTPEAVGRGLRLHACRGGWGGDARCGQDFPLASESVDVIVLQHVPGAPAEAAALFGECARLLVPGGRLGLFALNPLAPYRWRWRGQGLGAAEPLVWRRRLREAGLEPEPVSVGLGPAWRELAQADPRQGAGLRAAFLLRAEKRTTPLIPVRRRRPAVVPGGVPAT